MLILDLDAHCGGGTFELLRDDSSLRSVDIAVSGYDFYHASDRMTLDLITDAHRYLPTLERRLGELDHHGFDLVIYNAGMDPFERCRIGGLDGMTEIVLAERERMVFGWCGARRLPVAFVLAGGYVDEGFDRSELVALHRLTLAAAAVHATF